MASLYNFWCKDCTCGKHPSAKSRDFQINLEEDEIGAVMLQPDKFHCPNNEDLALKLVGQHVSAAYNKFDQLPGDKKNEVLLKRSRAEFQKTGKERKHEKLKDMMKFD